MAYNLDMVLNFQIRDPTDEDPQRYRMYARNKLEEWMADGLPTKESVLHDMTAAVVLTLSKEEVDTFGKVRLEVSQHQEMSLEQSRSITPAGIHLLVTKFVRVPPSFNVKEAALLLFKIFSYMSATPFHTGTPQPFEILGLLRVISMLILPDFMSMTDHVRNPLNKPSSMQKWIVARQRTGSDYRRLIFQSIAVPTVPAKLQPTNSGPLLQDDVNEEFRVNYGRNNSFLVDVSKENPGLTDMVDALTATQPEPEAKDSPLVPRAAYTFVARNMAPFIDLNNRQVTASDLASLLRFSVVFSVNGAGPAADQIGIGIYGCAADCEDVVRSMLAAFDVESRIGVTWGTFNRVICNQMPFLFQSLSYICKCFLRPPLRCKFPARRIIPSRDQILNPQILSQLGFFIPELDKYRAIERVYWTEARSGGPDTKGSLVWNPPCFVLISGRCASSRRPHIFGAFIPTDPREQLPPNCTYNQRTVMIFQLSPVHDVRRGQGITQPIQDLYFRVDTHNNHGLEVAPDLAGAIVLDGKRTEFEGLLFEVWEMQKFKVLARDCYLTFD